MTRPPKPAPTQQAPPQDGGAGGGGFGGGSFDVDSFTVLGIDESAAAVGPLSSVTVSDGRALDADDAGAYVAVLDATYASTADLAVGDTIDVGGQQMEVVGIVASDSSAADTAANVYIPLDVAQDALRRRRRRLDRLRPGGVVRRRSPVCRRRCRRSFRTPRSARSPISLRRSRVRCRARRRSSRASGRGCRSSCSRWRSLLAVLFTISGVSRRTREFGTLKAIGWSNRRVVGQVAGESMVQGLIGGVAGLALGLHRHRADQHHLADHLDGARGDHRRPGGRPGGAGGGGGPSFVSAISQGATDIVLSAPRDALGRGRRGRPRPPRRTHRRRVRRMARGAAQPRRGAAIGGLSACPT